MSILKNRRQKLSIQDNNFDQAASDLCEKALNEAKGQLHALLHNVAIDRLDKRGEFTQAFKGALEQSIARKLAAGHSSCLQIRRDGYGKQ